MRLEVWFQDELVASLAFAQVRVSDGEWHHLLVELSSFKDGQDIKYMASVSLDYGMYQVRSRTRYRTCYKTCYRTLENMLQNTLQNTLQNMLQNMLQNTL